LITKGPGSAPQAIFNAEQNGIVFIDEIDKVTRRQETVGADVSREGVQRDLLPLIEGRRVALVDDAISTGATAIASVRLLRKVGVEVAGMIVAMKQTNRWEAAAAALSAPLAVRAVYGCPLFQRSGAGWIPLTETQPTVP